MSAKPPFDLKLLIDQWAEEVTLPKSSPEIDAFALRVGNDPIPIDCDLCHVRSEYLLGYLIDHQYAICPKCGTIMMFEEEHLRPIFKTVVMIHRMMDSLGPEDEDDDDIQEESQ